VKPLLIFLFFVTMVIGCLIMSASIVFSIQDQGTALAIFNYPMIGLGLALILLSIYGLAQQKKPSI
jgi:hypothetical protein